MPFDHIKASLAGGLTNVRTRACFMLEEQYLIFHRNTMLHLGHYLAIVRNNSQQSRSHNFTGASS